MILRKTESSTILLISILLLVFSSCHKQQDSVVMGLPFQSQSDSCWGMVATDGSLLIDETYYYPPTALINGRYWVRDAEANYMLYAADNPHRPVTSLKYVQAGHFFDEVTLVQEKEGAPFSVIDKQGCERGRIDAYNMQQVVMAHNFSDGLALICTDGAKYGYIDTQGEVHIKPIYDMAFDFSDGLAIVGMNNNSGQTAWSVIDKQGKIQFHLSLPDSRMAEGYTCGRLAYHNTKWDYCGILDKRGEPVHQFPDKIEEIWPYRYDAAICLANTGVGLVDGSGKVVVPPNYLNGKIVAPNRAAFMRDGRWALFTFRGKPLTPFEYDEIMEFYHPEYAFARQGDAWIQIDRAGEAIEGKRFKTVYTDAIIDRLQPQLFLRNNNHTTEETEETPSEQPDEHAKQSSMKAEVSPSSTPSLPVSRVAMLKEISERSPFFEEARRIVSSSLPEEDKENRKLILDYVEHFRAAYTTKDIDFLRQLFSEEALIIVGKVVQQSPRYENNMLSQAQVVYNIRSKKEYLSRLQSVFAANKTIDVYFEQFNIMKHPTIEGFYGVSLKQGYRSDLYSDEGYLFLLWDFRDKHTPMIHVRTWQPAMLQEGVPLPADEVFNLGSFHLQ